MQVERTGMESRPLLPRAVGNRLIGWVCKLAGLACGVVAAVGWLSLITWSGSDPSLTHAATGETRNLFGPVGAIFSDLLLQTMGFAATLVFLGPAYLAVELLVAERAARFKVRAMLFLVAVVVLAGALSSLPVPATWPIKHGLGGAIGDAIFNLAGGMTSVVLPGRGSVVAGLLMFAGGMSLLTAALGMTFSDWLVLTRSVRRERPLLREPKLATGGEAYSSDTLERSGETGAGRARDHHHRAPSWEDEAALPAPVVPPRSSPVGVPASSARSDFDQTTEMASRSIAERFAPASRQEARAPAPRTGAASTLLKGFKAIRGEASEYRRPSLNLLKRPPASRPGAEHAQPVLRGNARLLEDVLHDFGVKAEVKNIKPGPVVTLFEVEPARGTKSSRVIALADDIARSMSAVSARVAVVPGRNLMGIELPNVRRETVYLRELLEGDAWRQQEGQLPVVLGKGIGGEPVIADLARMPHLLIAGTTGSGKSVGVNGLILSLLYRLSPAECRLLLIDPKMLELSVYNGIPHLLAPVVTDPNKAAATLGWAVSEMEERYKRMAQLGVRNIEMFNVRVKNARKRGEMMGRTVQTGFDEATGEAIYEREDVVPEPMPYIVIVVDEFADLMAVAGKEIEGVVQRLAQMARAAGIHLVMATQRPSVDVVTGTIKANFPTRIGFRVASKIDSRTILGEQGAEQLLGAGDMLYSAGSGQVLRVHGPFVSDDEVESVAASLREQGEPQYVDALTRQIEEAGLEPGDLLTSGPAASRGEDDLYDRAVAVVHRDGKASTSYLQRRLGIGYNRAADLIERMERDGIVSPADHVGRRRILIGEEGALAEGD